MIKFNARCYVLIRSKQNRILVMQERWQGVDLNKFPGGGLELGEGLLECIHREIAEEFSSSEKLAYQAFFHPYRMLRLAIQAARATAVELLYQ